MTHVYRTKSGKLIQLESRLNLAEMDDMSLVYCGNKADLAHKFASKRRQIISDLDVMIANEELKTEDDEFNCDEFLKGQRACIDGAPCHQGASASFARGYGCQYASDQIIDSFTCS